MAFDYKIYVAGHQGMVGSAIVRALKIRGHEHIITRTHAELDLIDQAAVRLFLQKERPDEIYLAAAKVGGIHANNTYPGEFIYQNLMIQSNLIHGAFCAKVPKLLFLGSSCIYPKYAAQPMSEEELLSGKLESTNEPYAIAKIAGIKLCESYNRQYGLSHGIDYRSIMPTNLYGPGDNYHHENSHVVPALIHRFHEAKATQMPFVTVWGSGEPRRELLYVDDLADACLHVMNLEQAIYADHVLPMQNYLNVGIGQDVSIMELAKKIAEVVCYEGQILFDKNRPDGTLRKLLNSSRIQALGWQPKVNLQEGLTITYENYLETCPN